MEENVQNYAPLIPFIPLDTTVPYRVGFRTESFVPVDKWIPGPNDWIFIPDRGFIIMRFSARFGLQPVNGNNKFPFDAFYLNTKRCYNNMRDHIALYLNYFEHFYDPDHELEAIYLNMKYKMDIEPEYTEDMFITDLQCFMLNYNCSIFHKINQMNEENYNLKLSYRNNRNPVLQYTEYHAKLMMRASLLMNTCIPLITHFLFVHRFSNSDNQKFIIRIFDYITTELCDNIKLYNKLYETACTNIAKNANDHATLWGMQSIRGIGPSSHTENCVENIIVSIMPKYVYDQNIIHFNYKSIINNTKFQVTDISYEYTFVSLSSSKRDEDNNSEFDKFESYQTKDSEAKFLINRENYRIVMRNLERMWGPFDEDEISYFFKELSKNDTIQQDPNTGEFIVIADQRSSIRETQKGLIFLLFCKDFGDPISLREINMVDYLKLIIMARKILQSWGLPNLAYIFTSRFETGKIKALNAKEKSKIETHRLYNQVLAKYSYNMDCINRVLELIGLILASKFTIIDYYDRMLNGDYAELDGVEIPIIPDSIIDEVLLFVLKI